MRISQGKVTFAVVGLGGRAATYLSALQQEDPDAFAVAAAAEPDPEKRAHLRREYGVPAARLYPDDLALMEQPRLADVAIIGTQDALHFREASALLEKGYDLILEKPMATSLEQLRGLLRLARRHPGQIVAVCHVLRHTALFGAVHQIIASGRFGPVISIQHNENIGYYHFANSYVRGAWRNDRTSGPLSLTKSCHDMDLLLYLLGDRHACTLSSLGGLSVFRPEHFDEQTMARQCVDCPQQDECAYSAVRIFRSGKIKSIVFDLSTAEKTRQNLGKSPYGRCVYRCDNNVADHQATILSFDGGVTAAFNLSAFTAKVNRSLKVMCSFGEICAWEKPYRIETTDFRTDETECRELDIRERGHGGGDRGFIRDFMESYLHGAPFSSTLENAMESHVMSLLAEESRRENGAPRDVKKIMEWLNQ